MANFFLIQQLLSKLVGLYVGNVNTVQLKLFQQANWENLQPELVKYAEMKVRGRKWRSGSFLPKGFEAPDIVASCITKTMNTILDEDDEDFGKATWNQEKHPQLIDHLRSAIDSEVANLVRSVEHKKTNYSPSATQDEAQDLFETTVDAATAELDEDNIKVVFLAFEEFKARLMDELKDDKKAVSLVGAFTELSKTHDVVKHTDAAKMLSLPIEEIRNLVKKVRRAAERLNEIMELEYAE